MTRPTHAGPDLDGLFELFPSSEYLADCEIVAPSAVPQPYRKLLVHEHHMTVTVEEHHGDLVDVKVLAEHHDDQTYARKILLALQKTGRVVQFGLMRFHFQFCSDKVRDAILAKKTPLGRILIQNNVLRRIEPTAFLRVVPGPAMMKWFGLDKPEPTYGRLAIIHCNDEPAVELLEIVTPE